MKRFGLLLALLLMPVALCAQVQNAPASQVGGYDSYGNYFMPKATGGIFGPPSLLTTAATTTSTSFAATGIVLPTIPPGLYTPAHGRCMLIWEGSSTSYTTTFGFGASAAPVDLWTMSGPVVAGLYSTITSTTTTAVTGALTPAAGSTAYLETLDFTLLPNATSNTTLQLYFESSNASGTSSLEPGSYCQWLL